MEDTADIHHPSAYVINTVAAVIAKPIFAAALTYTKLCMVTFILTILANNAICKIENQRGAIGFRTPFFSVEYT